MLDAQFVTIAKVVKPQGRHGEVAADVHTDFPELFADRTRLFALFADGSRRELELEAFWSHKGRIILKFTGVDSISDAEALAGCEIQIPAEERAPLEPGTVYVSDLKGCVVSVLEKSSGATPSGEKLTEREIGWVADVLFGAGEAPLLIVREAEEGQRNQKSGKEFMIPYAEEYVQSADLAAKRIVMVLPEGMLDLDAPLSSDEKRRQQQPQDADQE